MFYTLILENQSGEQINLSTTANQYMTSKIEGLNPPAGTVSTSSYAGMNGSYLNNAFIEKRNVVISFAMRGIGIEKRRHQLYHVVKPSRYIKIWYKTANIELIVLGCDEASTTAVKEALLAELSAIDRAPLPRAENIAMPRREPVRKVEHFDTTQAKLCMLFTLGRPMQPEQLAAVRLAMALYGGSVTSRLFLNVRERDHLCYYCSSSFQSFTGSMAVNSGVEHTDAARAEQAVLKELADLCDGPITDEELEDCRRGLLAGMNGLEDTLGGIETWYYMEVLRGGPVQTPDDARRALLAVTRENVRDILKQFTLSVSCLLTREEGNENG